MRANQRCSETCWIHDEYWVRMKIGNRVEQRERLQVAAGVHQAEQRSPVERPADALVARAETKLTSKRELQVLEDPRRMEGRASTRRVQKALSDMPL